jgi:hypothetical protein
VVPRSARSCRSEAGRSPASSLRDQPQLAPSHDPPDQLLPLQLEPLHELPDQDEPLHELPDHEEPLHELPDHDEPLHELPDHEEPLHELPDHDEPLHELPDHDEPLHELPDHEEPLQELPVQTEPFHMPPDQLEPAASRAAIQEAENGLPKMSCSPCSTTPFIEMWSVPREASREPVPVDGALYCSDAAIDGIEAPSSLSISSSPQPCCFQLKDESLSQLEVSISFTWSGVSCG